MDPTPTIRDVARLAGVSAMTVSRVLNESPRVAPATRRRVEAAIAELGYVPNNLARGLTRRRSRSVAVVVPDIANPFFTLVVRGAEEVAWRFGYHVLLANSRGDLERERANIDDMLAFRVEGLLLAPAGDGSAAKLRALDHDRVPFVLVDRSVPGLHADLVQGDSVRDAKRLVDYLLRLGHRRIGMITESGAVSTARERLAGYREALESAALAFDPDLVVEASAIDPGTAREAAIRLLELSDPPSAIFAVNNVVALGAAEAARDRGLELPLDLGLVCFDDVAYAPQLNPFLTAIAQPAETFGTVAMQLLLDRLGGQSDGPARSVVLPGELVVRSSAAPAATAS
jgi:LacI family transcriptional regulator, galactose operon repressor